MADSPSSFCLRTDASPPKPSSYPFISNKYPELDLSFVGDSQHPDLKGKGQTKKTARSEKVNTSEHKFRSKNSTKSRRKTTASPTPSPQNESPASNDPLFSLDGVELNSTLCLKAQIEALQASEFQSQKCVEKTLQSSEWTKKLIDTRATEGVNITRSKLLFNSLVSINVQEDQLVSQARQDRLTPPAPQCREREEDTPSLHFLKTHDLYRQVALPPDEESPCKYPCPSPFPVLSTFDLHIRQRRWES